MIRTLTISAAVAVTAGALPAAPAPSAQDCARYVHWHAVEAGHADQGQGRVAWAWIWTAEGLADDYYLVDCQTGQGVKARVRSERMQTAIPFDRRAKARAILTEAAAYPHFFRWEDVVARLADLPVPVEDVHLAGETCACAAFYPDLRGDKPAFTFETAAWALDIGADGKARKRATE